MHVTFHTTVHNLLSQFR